MHHVNDLRALTSHQALTLHRAQDAQQDLRQAFTSMRAGAMTRAGYDARCEALRDARGALLDAIDGEGADGWPATVFRALGQQPPPTVRVVDEGGHFTVTVDRHDDRGLQLVGTTPTHRGAQHYDARALGYAEGLTTARGMARRISDRYTEQLQPNDADQVGRRG